MTDAEPQFGAPGKKAGRQAKKTWKDMTPQQRTGSIIGGVIQLILAAIAWTDLARRPAEQVNGPKPLWALAITINFIGPISYFIWGRRQPGGAGRKKIRRR